MAAPGGLQAATQGSEARQRFAENEEFEPDSMVPADSEAFSGPWAGLGADARHAEQAGHEGLVDDDVAFVTPLGIRPDRGHRSGPARAR
jgi:hypothetical protein